MTGAELRALRMSRGLSQTAFARHLGISRSQLQNYEDEYNRQRGCRMEVPQIVVLASRWLEHTLPLAPPPRPGRKRQ
jgi:transcriptional regulator with XRE-family HTH domain